MKINTTEIKEISKWMMVVGAGIFTCGAGLNLTCNHLEKKEAKAIHNKKMMEIEETELVEMRHLEEEATRAKTAKDNLYSEKLRTMDQETFAKFHAENVAKANKDILDEAERIKKEANATVVSTKLECNEKIDILRAECLSKIEEANKKRDEAIEKYNAIDKLFYNRNEVLKAKEALDAAVKKDQKAKDDKEELLKSLKDILD